jgi:hypothetical protein
LAIVLSVLFLLTNILSVLFHSALQLFESCFIRCAETLLSGLNNTLDCDKEKHEDTKAVIWNRISKKDRQYIGQKKKDRQYHYYNIKKKPLRTGNNSTPS